MADDMGEFNKMVEAGACPVNPQHAGARVASTQGMIRYCICDTCGKTWQVTGPYAAPWRRFLVQLAAQFREAKRFTEQGRLCVTFDAKDLDSLATQMEDLARPARKREAQPSGPELPSLAGGPRPKI